MKKVFVLLLAIIMVLCLTACGEKPVSDNSDPKNETNIGEDTENKADDKIDVQDAVDQIIEEAEELNAFSIEAVEHYLKAYGIALSDLEPEWDYVVNENSVYADAPDSGYGHAVIRYNAAENELTDEQIHDFYAKVFAVTAAASDDGHNIIGYEFAGEGEDALAEVTLEEALDSWMPGWGFRSNGTLMVVYVETGYDNEKDSEFDRLFYYNSVKADIGTGLQASFDDTWSELEDYFEENEDAINDALEDYFG